MEELISFVLLSSVTRVTIPRMRVLVIGITAAMFTSIAPAAQDRVPLRAGMVIDRSVTFRPGVYRLASASIDTPVIIVRGNDVTVDLTGVELNGSAANTLPNRFAGLAILVDGGERVTIRNARIRGYKV